MAVENKDWKLVKKKKSVQTFHKKIIGKDIIFIKSTAVISAEMRLVHNFLSQLPADPSASANNEDNNSDSEDLLISGGNDEEETLERMSKSTLATISEGDEGIKPQQDHSPGEKGEEGGEGGSKPEDPSQEKKKEKEKEKEKEKGKASNKNNDKGKKVVKKWPFSVVKLDDLDAYRGDYALSWSGPVPTPTNTTNESTDVDFCCTRYSFMSPEDKKSYCCFFSTYRKDYPKQEGVLRGEMHRTYFLFIFFYFSSFSF